MSAFLPLVQVSSQSPADEEDVPKAEARDSGGTRSSTPLEEASSPLHSSETLEYPDDKQRPSCLEADLWADVVLEGDEPGSSETPGPTEDEDPPLPKAQAEPPPPPLCDPSIHIQVAPGGSLMWRSSEEEDEEEGVCAVPDGAKALAGSPEHRPFLVFRRGSRLQSRPPPDAEWPAEEAGREGDGTDGGHCGRCSRPSLKATAALAGSLLVYPCFLYGAYVFLPFDVPLMPSLVARLIYTLRCSTFATIPILMGFIVYGLARLCSSSLDPFGKRKDEVEIHLRFITDSIHLFLLFFVNLLVLSTYIPHEVLKLLPLLTAFFALARLIYWLTFAISSTFRGFGYGLTFFPILGLLVCNLSYMFVLAPDKMFATSLSEPVQEEQSQSPRQRFWG